MSGAAIGRQCGRRRFRIGTLILLLAPLLWFNAAQPVQSGSTTRDVVSIGGSVTEIIYALGQQDRLVARDSTSSYPPEVRALPDVGYVRALSPEGVLSVGPKLVIAQEGAGPAEAVDVLRASSVTYVDVPDLFTPEGVEQKIRVIGDALGVPEQAAVLSQQLAQDMQNVLGQVARQSGPKPRVLFVLSTQGGRILAGGQGTAADGIISLAGGANVITSFEGYKPVTPEAIAVAAPQVILMMNRRGGHASSNAELWSLPALAQTPAAQKDAVIRIDGLLLLGFGPRTPAAIEMLHAALYPADPGK